DGREAPCRTQDIELGAPIDPSELHRVEGVRDGSYERLAGRYGYAAQRVLEMAQGRGELAQENVEGLPDLLAQAPFAGRTERARTVADVLLRRTRLGLLAARRLAAPDGTVATRVARAMAPEVGWDEARIKLEVARFADEVAAEGLIVPNGD